MPRARVIPQVPTTAERNDPPPGAVDDPRGPRAATERKQLGDLMEVAGPCRALWVSVINLAIRDLDFLRQRRNAEALRDHERGRMRRIREHDPAAFLASDWFEEICDYLRVPPDVVRARVRTEQAG